jgi:hypothetical protein
MALFVKTATVPSTQTVQATVPTSQIIVCHGIVCHEACKASEERIRYLELTN